MDAPVAIFRTNKSVDAEIGELLRVAEDQQLLAVPSTESQRKSFKRRCEANRLVSPFKGMYSRVDYWKSLSVIERHIHIFRTFSYLHPNTIYCDISAAVLYGLSVSYGRLNTIHVLSNPRVHGFERGGVRMHCMTGDFYNVVNGLKATDLAQTVFSVIRYVSFCEGIALADSALRAYPKIMPELLRLEQSMASYRGVRNARRVLKYADGRAESGGESWARARMIELGYVVPQLQVKFRNPLNPWKNYRVDMLVERPDGVKVAIELDGKEKYFLDSPDNPIDPLMDERQREAALTAQGLEVMRLRMDDVYDVQRFVRIMNTYHIPKVETR